MIKLYRKHHFLLPLFVALYWIAGCRMADQQTTAAADTGASDKAYTTFVLSGDTIKAKRYADSLQAMLRRFALPGDKTISPWYYYFRGSLFVQENKFDSASLYFRQISPAPQQTELQTLKDYALLNRAVSSSNIANADLVTRLLAAVKRGEQHQSVFTYRLYDLLAKSYYNNHNVPKAIEYTVQYYNHHPFKSHPIIRQRYFDISFMLSVQQRDTASMKRHLDSARQLAVQIDDSLALARTYDYEAQLYAYQENYGKAVVAAKRYFNYLQTHQLLHKTAFNNLATSFVRNHQTDSAIYYYKAAILWAGAQPERMNLLPEYQGLHEAYKQKGDYEHALDALLTAFNIYGHNMQAIEASKIEELHTQYQTEKKDQAIAALQMNNELNKKVISQQRWIFVAVCILLAIIAFYIYNVYRQKLLKEKNEKLEIENKRLLLEQKTRQMQLNPHFIYNAIANMQGLISSDKKREANAYLVSFSKLMRNVLELNRHDLIPLEDEIGSLKNYIELQQMRFEHAFAYQIDTEDTDVDAILIPPMLVQPFVENSIEHGFKSIDYPGMLTISFRQEQTQLVICIDDNGAGEKAKTHGPREKKSLSRIIVQERLDLLFNKANRQAYFEVGPKTGEQGFRVVIYLPLLTD
ncbi:tetratricopeptide repeat-containing sensor histidine kinase [Chitinophaga qingshengii]|uniref:Histidine kinase n=1 Tax=Chitinophaga qingshengii TaxID=1569794 RepID=A0ABR7TM95_9BACT|nr:histidine kinase [Chitinophaga qingshengii]MBC9930626.1 histidine kinase [Chitinophaga qingshengii]